MPAMTIRSAAVGLVAALSSLGHGGVARAAGVDESALRYYAASRQTARVELETRRLQALDPTWRVPDDLDQEELGRQDEAELWTLYGADRLDELTRALEDRRRRDPQWRPSPNLAAKYARKLARAAVLREAAEGHWDTVSHLAASIPSSPNDPQLGWILAEALSRGRREAECLAELRRILDASTDPSVRRATIHKGLALLGLEAAETLIAQGRTLDDGTNEWSPIQLDITRARISGFLNRRRTAEIPGPEVEALAASVRGSREPAGAALLGWYAFQREDLNGALDWFKLAIAGGGDAMTAHGLAHTLRRLGYVRDAENVAYAWRRPLVQNAILYTDIVEAQLTSPRPMYVEPDRLERYGRVVSETQSGEGAQALAWYAYNLCQYEVALSWFERAMAWYPKEGTAVGYAVTLRRLNRQRDFVQVVNRYDGLFPRVVALVFREEAGRSTCDQTERDVAALVRDRPMAAGRPMVPGPAAGPADTPIAQRGIGFPIAVASENPLRTRGDKVFGLEAGIQEDSRPKRDRRPLLARRVLGVIAMPYEQQGVSLLPAYDGTTTAAILGSSELPAPRGSVWADEQRMRRTEPAERRPRPDGTAPRPTASTVFFTVPGRFP